jgi:hypothetical protein
MICGTDNIATWCGKLRHSIFISPHGKSETSFPDTSAAFTINVLEGDH